MGGHKSDLTAIFYLDPGTTVNHADRTKQASVKYNFTKPDEMEIWTILPVKAGDELFTDYSDDYIAPKWYEELMTQRNLTPLSALAAEIDKMFQRPGVVDMEITTDKSREFYTSSAQSMLRQGVDGEETSVLNIVAVGDAVDIALVVAAAIEHGALGSIVKKQM